MAGDDSSANETILRPELDGEGARTYRSTFSPAGRGNRKVLLAKLPAVIPVVFLPGIMGTNLRHAETGEPVWRPPNASLRPGDIFGIIRALFTWGFKGAKERQELLRGENLEVDDRGPVDVGGSGLSRATARERGWGTVSRMSYNPIMASLQQRLNSISEMGELLEWWNDEGLRSPEDYGEELGGNEALTRLELEQASLYQYDVWCAGYNWLDSNLDSARELRTCIETRVLDHYRQRPEYAGQVDRMKVILVTHSMGGLVSRALTEIEGYDRVLGVVSGVQPATGAPAIYHHMRCGYEGAARFILGRNAAQVTAVVANSPGAMELVPAFDHDDGNPWLFACRKGEWDAELKDSMPLRLPVSGNSYEDIYKTAEWYGLVPRQNEKYLDMSTDSGRVDSERNLRDAFDFLVDGVSGFHRNIAGKYHERTYAHYGVDDSRAMHSWRNVVWMGEIAQLDAAVSVPQDDGRGSYSSRVFPDGPQLTAVYGAGDGTVCDRSGAAPGKAGVQASFRHGPDSEGEFNELLKGYGHQDSYNDKYGARTEWATLYAIGKLALEADWHPEQG